jgi:hypothetical protein
VNFCSGNAVKAPPCQQVRNCCEPQVRERGLQ